MLFYFGMDVQDIVVMEAGLRPVISPTYLVSSQLVCSAIKHKFHVNKKSCDIVIFNKGKSVSRGLPF